MSHTLERLLAPVTMLWRRIPGSRAEKKCAALIQQVLTDKEFLAAHLGNDVPERKVL